MIDWFAFASVAAASLVAACSLVATYALGVRLMSSTSDVLPRTRRLTAIVCFAVCGALVLFGIYLVVPALHGG
ncbi:MAG TPA: hypothetical protein PK282_06005 [Rhodoglobus sp.]|jgi:hypothetical protein|nr:hypothetical protein [Rhodoglobus sp.]HOW02074.1 hypothetical protein [Rhodoglobus sp.]HPG74552.1 hypothetical protein [Rhodoglobus sp.]HPM51771.1 hypothetical protein [Rhodoglobus sp.]HPU02974.1 hypothetical protein [Rhodoglobus sp.]